MKQFLVYTKLQTKKILRTYPAMLIMTFLLALVLGAMLYMQSTRAASQMTGDEDAKTSIGIIGLDSSPYLKMGLSMLENMDPSKVAVRFENLDHDTAVRKMKSGELTAAVEIPAGTTDRLLSGDLSSKMTLILPDSSAALGPLLIRELSTCISGMIGQIESASCALSDFYTQSGVTSAKDISDAQTDLLYTTLKKILQRNHMFTVRRMKTSSTLTIESYYLCAMFLLLILLTGVMCAGSYIKTDRSLEMLLRIRGFGPASQIPAEFLSLLALILMLGLLFVPAGAVGLGRMPITFSELQSGTPAFFLNFVVFALKAIPVVCMAAALDILLYEIADSLISGVLLQFLSATVLAYLSGIFYPLSSLPEGIRKVAPFLPTGQAMLYLRKCLIKGNSVLIPLIWLIVWTAVFLGMAVLIRKRKLEN